MVKAIKFKDKTLFIRVPNAQEIKSFESLRPSKSCAKYLGLVIGEKITVNSFTGKINELQTLVAKIKEALQ